MVLMSSDYKALKHGDKAPLFELVGTDEKIYSLSTFKGSSAYLIIFICNHCPYVKPKLDEINRIAKGFKEKGLTVIGINPNEDLTYPEDSFENMKKLVNEKKLAFNYLRDESQETAKAYGAVCTPDPFLFNKELKLIFHSRIDDTHGNEPAKKHELHEAVQEFLETGKIKIKEEPSRGCSIKWRFSDS